MLPLGLGLFELRAFICLWFNVLHCSQTSATIAARTRIHLKKGSAVPSPRKKYNSTWISGIILDTYRLPFK